MYISLGLLWLCFKIIQGEITRCPLGGIRDMILCKNLNKDPVFYRFYLNGFQTQIIGDKNNVFDAYDKAFEQFKENSKNKAIDSALNVLDPLDVMRPSKGITDTFNNQGQTISMDEFKQKYMKIIFRQSLTVNCNPLDSTPFNPVVEPKNASYKNCFNQQGIPTKIKKLWDETLSIGTDTYRLKFHNKLLSTYQGIENTLSREDCMVFIESYYNAASTYYFSRMYKTAQYVIEDGIHFGLFVRDHQFKDLIGRDIKTLNSWLLLCESFKQDILKNISDTRPSNISGVSTINYTPKLSKEIFYSSESALFYRKYFLDDILEERKKKTLEKSATDLLQSINDNNIIYTKYNLIYNYLLHASFGKTIKVKLENIIKAIKLPVLSIEDRLLNYKALLMTMDMIHICLDENGLLSTWESCEPMNELKESNEFFREKIIPKLKNVYCVMHDKEIIMKLIYNLSTKDAIINERLLHVIVTSAIDFAELEPIKYETHITTIKSAIDVLEYFVKVLEELKEKSENNKTEKDNTCESEEFDTDDLVVSKPEEKYSEIMKKLLSNLIYTTKDQKTMNVFIAYKWLAELYGVLCDNTYHLTKYQKRLKKYIGLADKLSKDIDRDDDHLKYLKNKQEAKILIANNSWEVNSWPGGWYFSNLNTETSKILDTSTNGEKSNMLKDLNYLKNESKCPYINKIEINILLYRLYVMDSVNVEYKQLYQYLESAINELVITGEDRARNMEAHELLSIYLMILNRHSIEKVHKSTGSQNGWIRQYT